MITMNFQNCLACHQLVWLHYWTDAIIFDMCCRFENIPLSRRENGPLWQGCLPGQTSLELPVERSFSTLFPNWKWTIKTCSQTPRSQICPLLQVKAKWKTEKLPWYQMALTWFNWMVQKCSNWIQEITSEKKRRHFCPCLLRQGGHFGGKAPWWPSVMEEPRVVRVMRWWDDWIVGLQYTYTFHILFAIFLHIGSFHFSNLQSFQSHISMVSQPQMHPKYTEKMHQWSIQPRHAAEAFSSSTWLVSSLILDSPSATSVVFPFWFSSTKISINLVRYHTNFSVTLGCVGGTPNGPPPNTRLQREFKKKMGKEKALDLGTREQLVRFCD